MIDELWKLEELEPGADLDGRVQRRIRASMRGRPSVAPFLPFETALYIVVLAVYGLYAGARAVQIFHEARTQQVLAPSPKRA